MFKKMFFSILSCVCLLIVAITVSYAWYITKANDDFQSPLISGKSTAAYYAGGDGSKEKPYKIANSRHLYNFAWLHYIGTYNQDYDKDGAIDQYYFEVIDDIDCGGLVLPPIGTTTNPFLGNFNGGNYTISNLKVSNNYSDFSKSPSSVNINNFTGCEIIGFFGVVGKYSNFENATITNEVNAIYNFNLDDINIRNSCNNTLAGIIAGYVNGNARNIGVHYGRISLASSTSKLTSFNNISTYTLIGDYADSLISWEDKPSSENPGGGTGSDFGGTLNFPEIYQRMSFMDKYGYTDIRGSGSQRVYLDNQVYYEKDENDDPTDEVVLTTSYLHDNNYMPLVLNNFVESNYSSLLEEVPQSTNIGYYVGGSGAVVEKIKVGEILEEPTNGTSAAYTLDESGNKTGIRLYTFGSDSHQECTSSVDQSIRDILFEFTKNEYLYGIRFTSQIEIANKKTTLNNVVFNGETLNNLIVPTNSIYFKASQTGIAKIVAYKTSGKNDTPNTTRSLTLYRIYDENGNRTQSIVQEASYRNNTDWEDAFYYFEYPIVAGEEYAIGSSNGSDNAHFIYLDIGQNAGSGLPPSEDPEITYGAIEGIDFVYLEQNGRLNDIDSTTYSSVFFQISGTTTGLVEYYFRRNNDSDDGYAGAEGIVLFFAKNEDESDWTTSDGKCTDGDNTISWSYAGTKGLSGTSAKYPNEEDCQTLGTRVTGGVTNSNAGASSKCIVTYVYKDPETGELITISRGAVTRGNAITEPTFEILGYNILDWYLDENLSTEYDFASTAVNSNITIYAEVEKIDINTVTFVDSDDDLLITSIQVNDGKKVSISDPRKESNVFEGWYTRTDNGDGTYTYTKVDLSTYIVTDSITLYAKWEAAYNVTFVYDLGNGIVEIDTQEVPTSNAYVSRPSDPKVDRYTFVNWYTDDNYTSTFNFNNAISTDTTIYAYFEPITYYIVTFVDEAGNVIYTYEVESGQTVNKPTDPTKADGIFAGWFVDENFETEFNFASQITGNTTVYAYFQDALTVTFNYYDDYSEDVAVLENEMVAQPTDPTRTGYRFTGWYTDENCSIVFDFNTVITENTIIYAGWEQLRAVTFEYNNNNSTTIYVDDEGTINLEDIPTVNVSQSQYYDWYIDGNIALGVFNFDTPITNDITIVAVISNKYVVTFMADGEVISTVYKKPTEELLASDAPVTDEGDAYTIENWYSDSTLEIEYQFGNTLTGDVTIYAKVNRKVAITFVVTYNGTPTETIIYKFTNDSILDSELPQSTDNYYIVGWLDSNNNEVTSFEIIEATYNAIVVNKYTIIVNDPVGTTTLISDIDGNVTLPEAPTNGNAVFAGWSDGTNTYDAGETISVTNNMELTATWTYASSVTFDANGGTFESGTTINVELTNGIISSLPPDPTYDGYIFLGWFLDADREIELDATKPITVDTIYAGWEEEAAGPLITFDAYGGTFNGNNTVSTYANSSGIARYPEEPTRENYTFLGYGLNNWDNDVIPVDYEFTQATTIYAKWQENTYVIFDDGIYETDNIKIYVDENGYVTLPSDPTYEGRFFRYWYASVNNQEVIITEETIIESSVTAYVKWGYYYDLTVKCYYNGSVILTTTVTVPTDVELDSFEAPTIVGYEVEGWYSNYDCTTPLFPHTFGQHWNAEVYIKYELKKYEVTFETNGGSLVDNQIVVEGQTINNVIPTKLGNEFAGWYIDSSLDTEFDVSTPITSDTTLYAKWNEVGTATVTYVLNGGDGLESEVVTIGSYIAVTPIKSGYRFAGWYMDENLANEFDILTPITSDTTLYAKWDVASAHKVTFVYDLDSSIVEIGTQEVESGSCVARPSLPVRDGYTFAGWYTDQNYNRLYKFSTEITEDTTIYAKWLTTTNNIYKIYLYGDSTDFANDSSDYGQFKEYYQDIAIDFSLDGALSYEEILSYFGGSIEGYEFSKAACTWWGSSYDGNNTNFGTDAWFFGAMYSGGNVEILFDPTE